MTTKHCPTEADLLAFADADLPPDQLARVEQHLRGCAACAACAARAAALRDLIGDVAAPPARHELDVAGHVAAVMKRLDDQAPPERARGRRAVWPALAGLAAAAAIAVLVPRLWSEGPEGQLVARGGDNSGASFSRDVGVQVYAAAPLRPLSAGSRIAAGTALTAGLRNLADKPAHLLLFAVDARGAVHWIAPRYTDPGSDPAAVVVAPAAAETLLPTAAAFDDLAPGPLRVVSLITAEPTRVSQIESLAAADLGDASLIKRFPRAELRQLPIEVTASGAP